MKTHATARLVFAFVLMLLVSSAFAAQSYKLSDSPSGVTLLSQDRNGLTMSLEVGELLFTPIETKEGSFTMLSITDFTRSYNIGEPNLPMANRLISIPYGCELDVKVIDFESEEISLDKLDIFDRIIPAQEPLSKSDDPADIPFEFNASSYEQSGFYGLPLAEGEIKGVMRNVRLGMVKFSPVEYNPTENTIRVYKRVVVKVDYVGADWTKTETVFDEGYSPVFEAAYSKIINYQPALLSSGKDDLTRYPIKYVIVSDRMFEAQLQPFIEWKIKKGFEVIEAYTDVIGTSNTAIKNYLQNLYNTETPKPSFVLLVGDDQEIQAFSGSAGSHITDMKFVEFTGDWFPEIYWGRFSAHTTALLQPQIDKTLEYERYEMPDPSYLGEVTMIAGVDGTYAITHGNGQINYGTNLYFNAAHGIYSNTWLYPASADGGAAAAIIQTINDGLCFANYTAHCGHTEWSNPNVNTGDIQGFTNNHKWLLAVGNCCLSNTFGDDYSTPCWGEVFLQEPNKGGIGYIGGTNSTYWDEDYWWGVGYGPVVGGGPTYEQTGLGAYDGVFHDHGEPLNQHYVTNYAIAYVGNMAVTESGSSREQYYWEIYELMGDPSVMTYMGVPAVNPVVHPSTIMLTAPTVSVQADPFSYVGISIDGELKGAAFVDASGTVEIPVTAFAAPGVADIVVTAQNRQPYISTIQVITPDGPYVIYDSYVINDAAGNNNGVMDAAESIVLGVQVKNVGPDDALDVVATLSTGDGYVTMIDDTEAYGTVLGNEGTAYSADAFAFDIAGNTPDGRFITFDLTVSGVEKLIWESHFSIQVHAPNINQLSITIDDATGNMNGILDPGETANIIVTLENSGSGDATNVTADLSENDQFLSVSDASAVFGDLPGGGGVVDNSADVFTVSADASCPQGYAVSMNMALTGDLGFFTNIDLMITVGDRVAFYYDDFAFDQGWSGLGGTAEWTIGSPQGAGGDPSLDHSPTADNQVLGNDLTSNGQYNNSIPSTQWVYSPIIDCSDYASIEMRYWHLLGIESSSYDHAYFEVYDGTMWQQLFSSGAANQETSWNEEFIDMSQYADANPAFQIRFGLGPTDGSVTYSGWNIDDIELKGYFQGMGGTPILDLAPAAFLDSLVGGEIVEHTLLVKNPGDGTLRVRFSPAVGWISCVSENNYIAPGDSIDFPFTVNSGSLVAGLNVGALAYTSNVPGNMTGSVPVNVFIYPPDLLLPETACVDSLVEDETAAHSFYVKNVGDGNLNIEFSPGATWLSCSTSDFDVAPGDSAEFPFSIDAAGMTPGDHVGTLNYSSNDPDDLTGTVGVNLYIYAPVMELSQTSITETLQGGEQMVVPLTINNTGPGVLHYTVGCTMFDMKAMTVEGGKSTFRGEMLTLADEVREPIGYRSADPDKTPDLEEPYFGPQDKGTGGPDAYGYLWIDSDEPGGPAFNWVDISTVGTAIALGDDQAVGPMAIGFTFPFYENAYNELYFSSNGIITFGAGYTTTSNTVLPYSNVPNNMISMWWDDLDPEEAGNVYYYYDSANNRFIISFVGIRNYQNPSGTGSLTFQAILYQTGRIVLQYGTMDPGEDAYGLAGATVGIENSAGNDGLTVVYNAAYMHDNLAITFSNSSWLSAGPESGTIQPGGSGVIDVLLNAGDLEDGPYTGQVGIGSNDPLNPSMLVPVTMIVGGSSNMPPIITEIGPQTVMEGENLNFTVIASDPDGQIPALIAQDVPENATFLDNEDGTGTFDFNPDIRQSGVYYVIFIASDGELADTLTVEVSVENADVICGDADGASEVDIDDAVFLIGYIFAGGPAPDPIEVGDVDCSGAVDIDDAVYVIAYIFASGPEPCANCPMKIEAERGKTVKVSLK
ncbi:MAG: hypothetical protein KKG33_09565 [candidate division Zixibacteria bacterium]|nr:hypothetical protein [candidate division Zixibacteria bacterium]